MIFLTYSIFDIFENIMIFVSERSVSLYRGGKTASSNLKRSPRNWRYLGNTDPS